MLRCLPDILCRQQKYVKSVMQKDWKSLLMGSIAYLDRDGKGVNI